MAKKTSRNGKIDLLKFLFSLCIVLTHSKYMLPKAVKGIFGGFSLAVEFFFLVSGVLLMASIEKAEKNSTLSTGKETGIFMLRKYKSLYPEVAVAYVLRCILLVTFTDAAFFPLIEESWFDAFLLTTTGLKGTGVMTVTWYVSSMLICMMFLYPFIRKYKDIALNIVLPLGVVLIFGFMYRNYGTVRAPMDWNGFVYRGTLRAAAELSLGCLCYGFSKKLKDTEFSTVGKAILALIEVASYGIFVLYMATGTSGLRDFFYIFILCFGVIISFSGKSLGHELFNNRFFNFLGKFSFPLYLIHGAVSSRLLDIIPAAENMSGKHRLLIYVPLAMVGGLAVMLISNLIRKIGPVIISGVKKVILKSAVTEEKV